MLIDVPKIIKQVTEAIDMEPMLELMDQVVAEQRRTNELLEQLVENTRPRQISVGPR